MAWTAPMTAVVNDVWTSAQFNSGVRDNMLQTMPGLAAAADRYFASSGANAIAERQIARARVETTETTASTTYANLTTAGPSVTATTGTKAMVWFTTGIANNTSNTSTWCSVDVSSATTVAASDSWSIQLDGVTANNINRYGNAHLFTGLTAGSNIFRMQYRVTAGTGSYHRREIVVMAL